MPRFHERLVEQNLDGLDAGLANAFTRSPLRSVARYNGIAGTVSAYFSLGESRAATGAE